MLRVFAGSFFKQFFLAWILGFLTPAALALVRY